MGAKRGSREGKKKKVAAERNEGGVLGLELGEEALCCCFCRRSGQVRCGWRAATEKASGHRHRRRTREGAGEAGKGERPVGWASRWAGDGCPGEKEKGGKERERELGFGPVWFFFQFC